MRKSIWIVMSLFLMWNTIAEAGQYDASVIGKAAPMWMEALGDINAQGDAVWTQWDGGSGTVPLSRAQIYTTIRSNVAIGDAGKASQAVGVSARSGEAVWIAGSQSTDMRRNDSHAMMWREGVGGPATIRSVTFDLGALTNKKAGAGIVQQSAAYGIAPVPGYEGFYVVTGFARDKVSNSVLADPIVWLVDANGTPSLKATAHVSGWLTGSGASGLVTSVASNPDTNTTWACGHTTQTTGGSLPYVQATCWTMTANTTTVTTSAPYAQLLTDLNSSQGFGNGHVITSLVHRVRTLPLGSNGELHSVAIGMAMIGAESDPSSYKWSGFVYDLDDGTLWKNFELVGGAETMVYDAAGLAYAQEGTQNKYGLDVVGTSRSVTAGNNVLETGPVTTQDDVGALRGISRRMLRVGVTDNGMVCTIDGDSTEPANVNYDQVVATSSDGYYRLARDKAGFLYRLASTLETAVPVTINQRDVPVGRTRTKQLLVSPPPRTSYYHVQIPKNGYTEAVLRVGRSIATCDSADGAMASAFCGVGAAAFDVKGPTTCSTPPCIAEHGVFEVALDGVGATTLYNSASKPSTFASTASTSQFAQIAYGKAGKCVMTPVRSIDANIATVTNPEQDHEGGKIWGTCGGGDYVYDTLTDVDHCAPLASKDSSCVAVSGNALSCYDAECSNGNPKIASVDANRCAIGPNNAWQCYTGGTYQQVALNYASPAGTQDNRCMQCDPGMNNQAWSQKTLSDDYYRCIAHMWFNEDECPGKPSWAFFSTSGEGSCYAGGAWQNGLTEFKMNDYWTNHMCVYAQAQNNDAETRNVSNTRMWEKKTSPARGASYTWPGSFQGMQSMNSDSKNFTNTGETRQWLFARRLRYLGQMNGGSQSDDGRQFYMGQEATTFYLQPGQEEWFLFYYNDPQKWQDRIGALVQFDGTRMDLDVDIHYACALDGKNNHPRMDGFRYCSAEGYGNMGDKRSAFGVSCGPTEGSGYDRSSYCKANTWQPFGQLPWTFSGGDSWAGTVPSDWGSKQGGIYVEGHIDCGTKPQDNSNGRSGWAFIKVKRRDTNATMCTPITLRSTWFHHNTKTSYSTCWN